jgi:hypothetical protein
MLHNLVYSILKHLGGIEQYGIFSLCLFSSIFAGVLIFAFFQKKTHLDHMSRVPLDEGCLPPAPERGCLSRSGPGRSDASEPPNLSTTRDCSGWDSRAPATPASTTPNRKGLR